MANEPAENKTSALGQVVDILAIFALIFVFIVIPPYFPEYVHLNNGYMEGIYSIPVYFAVLAAIVIVFGLIMAHSVKTQDY